VRIIDKTGPLNNFADRDHCLQYMAAIGLIFGELNANHYSDNVSSDSRIDALRGKMVVRENESFTTDYYDLEKRAIGNSIQVFFKDGTSTERVEVQYPIGHRNRRSQGIPALQTKFANSLKEVFGEEQQAAILGSFESPERLESIAVKDFLNLFVKKTDGLDNALA
jgi:2-methylcitrate dehydratase